MARNRSKTLVLALALVLTASAVPARAGVFRDTIRGLQFAGFNFVGQENPLSGGAQFQLSRNFTGQTMDFGATEVTLTGPVNFTFETGGRALPTLDFSLSTNAQAFSYVLETSSGAQDTTVNGNFLLDATGSMNTFGFYDMRLQLSSRQNVTQDGRFQDDVEEQLDFDIGPIDVSGNVFADLLALIFDPFFEATGTTNIFASFSGRAQLQNEFDTAVAAALAKAEIGQQLTEQELARVIGLGQMTEMLGGDAFRLSLLDALLPQDQVSGSGVFTLPEPGTLALLVAPVLVMVARRRR